jgi:sn-glycerol 3-phosphate transport system substrate-binding protein
VDNDNGRSARATTIDLTSPEVLTWVTWWQRMHKGGHYLYTGEQMDWNGTLEAFLDQKVPFMLNSSVMAEAVVSQGREAGFEVAAGRMPYNGDVPYGGDVIGGDSLWLAAGLDKVTEDGALAYLQYLINPANAAEWHKASGFIPITKSSYALLEEQGWFAEFPYQAVATEQLDAGTNSPGALGALFGDFYRIDDVMTQAMHDVLTLGVDPLARFIAATAEAQKLLDAYNAR